MTHHNKKHNKKSRGSKKESKKVKAETKISLQQLKLEAESVNLLYKQVLSSTRKGYATFAYWFLLFIMDYFIWNPLDDDHNDNNWRLYLTEIGVYLFLLPILQLRANHVVADENIDNLINDSETTYETLDQASADLALKGVTLALKTEMLGHRNFAAATLTAARTLYGYFFSSINPSLTITVCVNLLNLTLYYKLIADIKLSRENVKEKLKVLKEHLTKILSKFLKSPIASIPSPHLSCCLLIIPFDHYKHKVKASTLAKLMVELFRNNGIKVHRRERNCIIITADQPITQLNSRKINEIDNMIFQLFNTQQTITQVSRLAESMNELAKLTRMNENKLISQWRFEIEIPEKYRQIITKQKLLTIYAKSDFVLDEGLLIITGNNPNIINLEDLISQVVNHENNQTEKRLESKETTELPNETVDNNLVDDDEACEGAEVKQKTKKASNQEMLASLPHYQNEKLPKPTPEAYQVMFEWQKQKHISSQVDVVKIRNNIYGIFRFAEPAFEKQGLPEEGGISKFRSIFQAAKVAQRRVGAEGIILRETGTSVDKIKVLGAFGGWQVRGDRINATLSFPEASHATETTEDKNISLIVFHQVVPRH